MTGGLKQADVDPSDLDRAALLASIAASLRRIADASERQAASTGRIDAVLHTLITRTR